MTGSLQIFGQGYVRCLDLEGKNISERDKNHVSELSKMSPFIYKKLADHDRIPLNTVTAAVSQAHKSSL